MSIETIVILITTAWGSLGTLFGFCVDPDIDAEFKSKTRFVIYLLVGGPVTMIMQVIHRSDKSVLETSVAYKLRSVFTKGE